ncbi:MAG: hypothetical protein U0892_10680 [Pirellulales bacterium]
MKYRTRNADIRQSAADAQMKIPDFFAVIYYHGHTSFCRHAKDGKPRDVNYLKIEWVRAAGFASTRAGVTIFARPILLRDLPSPFDDTT